MLCIGTKRGQNFGLVYDAAGTIIGHVERRNRVAAGLKGAKRPFYTATLRTPNGLAVAAPSLGTRHPDRWSAARAIQAFHAKHPGLVKDANARNTSPSGTFIWDSSVSSAAACFKHDHFDVCALPYRTYPDPRVAAAERRPALSSLV